MLTTRYTLCLTLGVLLGCDKSTGPGNGIPPLQDKIVFSSIRDGGILRLYVMNVDGSSVGLVTPTGDARGSAPEVSPDGRHIAFIRNGDIWRMEADGSGQVNLTRSPAFEAEPAWSPDGSRIAFASNEAGNYDIYLMDADGANPVQVTTDPAADAGPSWSPNGTSIAFQTDRDGNIEIYVAGIDGTNATNLTNDAASDVIPRWSHDGTRIAFNSNRNGGTRIFTMDPDGSNVTELATPFTLATMPAWSPNDTRLAFAGGPVNSDIWIVNLDGSGLVNLTNIAATDLWPNWSP